MIMNVARRFLAIATALLLGLPAAAGGPILSVTHDGDVMKFDIAILQAMDTVEFETTTIWTEGVQSFSGVSLATLLNTLDVTEGTLKATAINDYAVEIPVEDAVHGGPIIAYMRNGTPMSVRDKGPFWVVYPYDSDPSYQTEIIYSRSIWQLDGIEVMD